VKDVLFRNEEQPVPTVSGIPADSGKIALINASMRGVSSNSAKLAGQLSARLVRESESFFVSQYLDNLQGLVDSLVDYPTLVICTPLYVDGLPSQMIRLMEQFRDRYSGTPKRIYLLSNMGLYESDQLVNLFSAVRMWCAEMHFEYCGGLGIGAGELVGGLLNIVPFGRWPLNHICKGMDELAAAIRVNGSIDDCMTGPVGFPRALYIAIANSGWKRMAKSNGLTNKDLFRRM
jgi:hypothetical protein